jgi:CBS domain-containing protein
MTKDAITIDPKAPLGTALNVMRIKQVRHLPVVDGAGQLVGIITDGDLGQAAFAPAVAESLSVRTKRRLRVLGERLENLCVRDAMTWVVVQTQPEALLAQAALVMSERHVGNLPIVDGGKLVGLITERDVLAVLSREGTVRRFDLAGFLW